MDCCQAKLEIAWVGEKVGDRVGIKVGIKVGEKFNGVPFQSLQPFNVIIFNAF
jgi:hypothetical protein